MLRICLMLTMSSAAVLVPTTAMAAAPAKEKGQEKSPAPPGEAEAQRRKILKTPMTDLDLSVEVRRALKKARITVMWQLVSLTREELPEKLNLGKRSLSELEELVADKGLSFGMDVSKYNLDED